MPDQHSTLSPSAAHRWLYCLAALAVEQFETDAGSAYADEGTVAHALAEHVLKNRLNHPGWEGGKSTQDYEGTYLFGRAEGPISKIQVTQEMADYVAEYVSAVWESARKASAVKIEYQASFSWLVEIEDQKGTLDAVMYIPVEKTLEMDDLKYGMGVAVTAVGNEQLMIYALAALPLFDLLGEIEQIRLKIHMPRKGFVSVWEISLAELMEFGERLKAAAPKVMGYIELAKREGIDAIPISAFNPSEKTCMWCKRRGKCLARANHIADLLRGEFP